MLIQYIHIYIYIHTHIDGQINAHEPPDDGCCLVWVLGKAGRDSHG
jgi:hypothetical protein